MHRPPGGLPQLDQMTCRRVSTSTDFLHGLDCSEHIFDASQFAHRRSVVSVLYVRTRRLGFRHHGNLPLLHLLTSTNVCLCAVWYGTKLFPATVWSTGTSITLTMYCSSGILNLGRFGLLDYVIDFSPGWSHRDPWQTVRSLPGSGYLLYTLVLMILTTTVCSTCLVTWETGRTLGCSHYIVIFRSILGGFTAIGLTVGWTCVFTTCSTNRCWILT